MSSDWASVRLGNVTTLVSGGTPSKGNPEYWGGSVPWVSAKDMKVLRLASTEDTLTALGACSGTRVASAGSTLILVRGMTLHNDVPICRAQVDMAFNQDVKAVLAGDAVDGDFLLYALLASKARLLASVDSSSHGTGRINTDVLRDLPIALPSLSEQRTIARILGTLDDKIELNRSMSRTLDEIAETEFGFRFGRNAQNGVSCATLGDLVSMTKGRSYRSGELSESDTALVTLKSFARQGGYRPDGLKSYIGEYKPDQVVSPGEIVVALTDVTQAADVIGNPALVLPSDRYQTLVASLDTAIVRPLDGLPSSFIYFTLKAMRFKQFARAHTTGTTVLHLKPEHLMSFPVAPFTRDEVRDFARVVDPLIDRISACGRESSLLVQIRDTLLRMLLSGEVRVRDAEKAVEEVQ